MFYYINIIFISIFFVLIIFPRNVEAQEINILMEKPDLKELQYTEQDLLSLNEYFKTLSANDAELQNVNVNFIYFQFTPNYNKSLEHQQYIAYAKFLSEQLRNSNSNIDMMIIDDRLLFSSDSFAESLVTEKAFKLRNLHKHFINLSEIININSLDYHDPNILKDGMFENALYGLPFELDFDLLYYDNTIQGLNDLTNTTQLSWDDLLSKVPPSSSLPSSTSSASSTSSTSSSSSSTSTSTSTSSSTYPLGYGFFDDDELLNFFIEYASEKYNLTEERKNDPNSNYYDVFYNETSVELYKSFRNFIDKNVGFENMMDEIPEAYHKFSAGETAFFKGKVSYAPLFKAENRVSSILQPKLFSTLNEKFIVINQHSKIKKEILAKVAQHLTSKSMQLYKYEKFGKIPTFNLRKSTTDEDILNFCVESSWLCQSLEQINRIRIKEIFSGKFSASFILIRINIPLYLDRYIRSDYTKNITLSLKNTKELMMTSPNGFNTSTFILYTIMGIFTILSVLIMLNVYAYRKHPYIKAISPRFCNLIIIGFIMSINSPVFIIQIHSVLKCQIYYIYNILNRNLILLPMFMIAFRIFCIYRNKSKMSFGKQLSNHRLSITIAILLIINVIVSIVVAFGTDFSIVTLGNLDTARLPICAYNDKGFISKVEYIYYLLIFIGIMGMVGLSGKAAVAFGEIKFLIILALIMIVSIITDQVIYKIPIEYYSLFFILLYCFYIISCYLCIYILVGSRLIRIKKQLKTNEQDNDKGMDSPCNEFLEIVNLIPMNKNREDSNTEYHYGNEMIRVNVQHNMNSSDFQLYSRNLDTTNDIVENEEEPSFSSQPNNMSFNTSMELLHKPEKTYSNSNSRMMQTTSSSL